MCIEIYAVDDEIIKIQLIVCFLWKPGFAATIRFNTCMYKCVYSCK
jgi:hypothetical protein